MRYQELLERYTEGPNSTVTHDGQLYDMNRILFLSELVPVTTIDLQELAWMYDGSEYTEEDQAREQEVDLSFPIIVTPWQDKMVIIDGFHRVHRAMAEGRETLPCRVIHSVILAMTKV